METIFYRPQFIDSARCMVSSLSNLVYNLAEVIHKIKCTKYNTCCLEHINTKDDLIEFKCLYYSKIYQKQSMKA